jgi:hypothetical protein
MPALSGLSDVLETGVSCLAAFCFFLALTLAGSAVAVQFICARRGFAAETDGLAAALFPRVALYFVAAALTYGMSLAANGHVSEAAVNVAVVLGWIVGLAIAPGAAYVRIERAKGGESR